jgi:hypothetical protein
MYSNLKTGWKAFFPHYLVILCPSPPKIETE